MPGEEVAAAAVRQDRGENGYVESLIGKLRDELLDREIFDTLMEAQVLVEQWRCHYNRVRPHSAPGYMSLEQVRGSQV